MFSKLKLGSCASPFPADLDANKGRFLPKNLTCKRVALAVLGALAAAAIIALCVNPASRMWLQTHLLHPLMTHHITLQQSVLLIAAPILGAGLVPLIIYGFRHRHKIHSTDPFPLFAGQGIDPQQKLVKISDYPANDKVSTNPKLKRALIGISVIGTLLGCVLAGSLLLHASSSLLQGTHISLGEGLLVAGLPAGGAVFLTHSYVIGTKDPKRLPEPPVDFQGSPIYQGL